MANKEELKKDFARIIKNGRLAHGYILFGEAREDQFTFLKNICNLLEGVKGEEKWIDTLLLQGNTDELGIDLVKRIKHFLYQKPVTSPRRILIIHFAEYLTPHAQHAILKISEEPPEHSLIFLTLQDSGTLFPALASRFQKIFMSGEERGESETGAASLKIFMSSGAKEKKEFLKTIIDDKKELDNFLVSVLLYTKRTQKKNWRIQKELLHRMTKMAQFSTNKRLQLEAALIEM